MRNIQKSNEPHCLTEHRCQIHSDYDNFNGKQELRDSLVSEQGGICAYCMQKIKPVVGGMKIEHWHSQDGYPREQLSYANMLGGVCLGGEGNSKSKQHCDTSKGNLDISKNPANPNHNVESMIRYLGNGIIVSNNEKFSQDLDKVLNLNHPLLVENRKAVLDGFLQSLPKMHSLGEIEIRRKIDQWGQPNGEYLLKY